MAHSTSIVVSTVTLLPHDGTMAHPEAIYLCGTVGIDTVNNHSPAPMFSVGNRVTAEGHLRWFLFLRLVLLGR